MNYGLELMSEIIPLLIAGVLLIDIKNGGEKGLLTSVIVLFIIEIPALVITLFCVITNIPQSNTRHVIVVAIFAFIALMYVIYQRQK